MGIKFKCPSCENEIALRFLKIGDEFKCRSCGQRGIIPESGEEVETINEIYNANVKTDLGNEESMNDSPTNRTTRFPAVKIVSLLTKIGAWIIFAASLIIGLMAVSNNAPLVGMGCIAVGIAYLITNLAFAELLLVFLAIEENTRKSQVANGK